MFNYLFFWGGGEALLEFIYFYCNHHKASKPFALLNHTVLEKKKLRLHAKFVVQNKIFLKELYILNLDTNI